MKFATIAEAFNHYKNHSAAELEKRAAEIGAIIDTDASADIDALNIELRGIKEARENIETRSQENGGALSFITGTSTAKKAFDAETVEATAEYRSAFLKSMLGRKLTEVEQRAFNLAAEKRAGFNQASNSAAVLPTATLNEIVKKARTMGGLLAECRAFAVPTKIAIPVGTPATKAAWHTEGAAVEADTASVATVSFEGYEILKVFSLSVKVATMSLAAFEAYLVEELTACVYECIGDALINGNGTNQGKGLNSITWNEGNSVTAASTGVTYANVVELVAMLKRGYAAGAKWAMSNATLYRDFYGMVDGNKRPIFIADAQGDTIGKLLGFEVVVDDNIADGEVYFGNYARYLGYNLANGVTIEASRESSFRSGLIDYRAIAVADCKPLVDEAFVKLVKASA